MYRGSDSSDRQMGHGWSSDPHSVISFLSLTTPWNLYVFHVTIFFIPCTVYIILEPSKLFQ